MNEFHVDVLFIGAHPDDIEMSAGGIAAKLVREGKRVAIVDCTRGELGSRGSISIRDEETAKATEILGVHFRENLNMTDGNIEQNHENILELVRVIRKYTPTILVTTPAFERHPDHESVHRLTRTAYFKSGLTKLISHENGVEQKPHRPKYVFCYMQSYHLEADFYVDVSDTFDIKMDSILAYTSQVHIASNSKSDEPQTFISSPAFLQMLESRSRYFGSMIGALHAEGFMKIEPLALKSMSVWL